MFNGRERKSGFGKMCLWDATGRPGCRSEGGGYFGKMAQRDELGRSCLEPPEIFITSAKPHATGNGKQRLRQAAHGPYLIRKGMKKPPYIHTIRHHDRLPASSSERTAGKIVTKRGWGDQMQSSITSDYRIKVGRGFPRLRFIAIQSQGEAGDQFKKSQ